jgi:hypothetical protein
VIQRRKKGKWAGGRSNVTTVTAVKEFERKTGLGTRLAMLQADLAPFWCAV